jgi:hypothetical protein
MTKILRNVSFLALFALAMPLAPVLAGKVEVPNINKRGDNEKAFALKLAKIIVTNARTSVSEDTVTVERFTKEEPKAGRTEIHIKAGFKGAVTGNKYTAMIVVFIDTSDAKAWEVSRITYADDSKNIVGYSRKNVDKLVDRLNAKGGAK